MSEHEGLEFEILDDCRVSVSDQILGSIEGAWRKGEHVTAGSEQTELLLARLERAGVARKTSASPAVPRKRKEAS